MLPTSAAKACGSGRLVASRETGRRSHGRAVGRVARAGSSLRSSNREDDLRVEEEVDDVELSTKGDEEAKDGSLESIASGLANVVANPASYLVAAVGVAGLASQFKPNALTVVLLSALPVVGLTAISKTEVSLLLLAVLLDSDLALLRSLSFTRLARTSRERSRRRRRNCSRRPTAKSWGGRRPGPLTPSSRPTLGRAGLSWISVQTTLKGSCQGIPASTSWASAGTRRPARPTMSLRPGGGTARTLERG